MGKKYILVCIVFVISGCLNQKTETVLPVSASYISFVHETTSEEIVINTNTPDNVATTTKLKPLLEEVVEVPKPIVAPNAINLAVPFQAQAPFADWTEPYKEGCEEASLIMVDHYIRGVGLTKEEMKTEIDTQVVWQYQNFGGHLDLSIERVARMAHAMYPDYTVKSIPQLTENIIREELRKGNPIIVPTAGRELGNPFFKNPGPLYHMLVIKGVTSEGRYITNDPGTRRGAGYVYDPDVLMAAIRDWSGTAPDGKPVGLVMYK